MGEERNSKDLTGDRVEPRSVAEKVMERIRREESWAYPITIHSGGSRFGGRRWVLFLLCAFLLLASFWVWDTSLSFVGGGTNHSWASTLDVVVGSGDLHTLTPDQRGGIVELDQMVAGIGNAPFLRTEKRSFEVDGKALIGAAFLLLHLYLVIVWIGYRKRSFRRS